MFNLPEKPFLDHLFVDKVVDNFRIFDQNM